MSSHCHLGNFHFCIPCCDFHEIAHAAHKQTCKKTVATTPEPFGLKPFFAQVQGTLYLGPRSRSTQLLPFVLILVSLSCSLSLGLLVSFLTGVLVESVFGFTFMKVLVGLLCTPSCTQPVSLTFKHRECSNAKADGLGKAPLLCSYFMPWADVTEFEDDASSVSPAAFATRAALPAAVGCEYCLNVHSCLGEWVLHCW